MFQVEAWNHHNAGNWYQPGLDLFQVRRIVFRLLYDRIAFLSAKSSLTVSTSALLTSRYEKSLKRGSIVCCMKNWVGWTGQDFRSFSHKRSFTPTPTASTSICNRMPTRYSGRRYKSCWYSSKTARFSSRFEWFHLQRGNVKTLSKVAHPEFKLALRSFAVSVHNSQEKGGGNFVPALWTTWGWLFD